jgi:hypothetical protein
LDSFYVGTKSPPQPAAFSFQVKEVVYFDTVDTITCNLDKHPRLYIPSSRTFPFWDCIYDDGEKTAFFSFSLSPFWTKHDVAVESSLEGDGSTSQVSKILNKLRNQTGHSVYIDRTVTPNVLVRKQPNNEPANNVFFFYGCGLSQQQTLVDAGTDRRKIIYRFVQFYCRDQMQSLGICF